MLVSLAPAAVSLAPAARSSAQRVEELMPSPVATAEVSPGTSARLTNGHGYQLPDTSSPQPGLRFGPSVQARRTTLHLPSRLPLVEWRRIGEQISLVSNASSWWLGDWLVYGQEKYPDRYRIAISEAALDYQTLRNYAWVARKFPPSRRRDMLSFHHHLEVAALSESDQDIWLERAIRFKWSKAELRRRIKASANGSEIATAEHTTALSVSIGQAQKQRWQEAAAAANCSLAEWVIQVADAAAACAPAPPTTS